MIVEFWYILGAAVLVGAIVYFVNFWLAKRKGETLTPNFWISLLVLAVALCGLLYLLQVRNNLNYAKKVAQLEIEKEREIEQLKQNYRKEMAYLEWRNKVFPTTAEMEKELAKNKEEFKLTAVEVANWRDAAHDNTLEKLIPKRDMQDVLNDYQARMKKSLAEIQSGGTLLSSDIRVLSENINTIRIIGKEYEKVLYSFRELYNTISTNPNAELAPPKQQYFLFFPIKRKEYNALLQQYYESRGNQAATAEVAAKLKVTIEKAEQEFAAINKRFEENLGFLESTTTSVTYNSEKLQNLIQAALDETEIINKSEPSTQVKINTKKKN